MSYLFSIIIPTFNGEKTIGNVLRKLSQLTSEYSTETVIIDSESTDNTVRIINRWKSRLSNLKLVQIKKKNFSHSGTRNTAARMAKGKYVCFFSQDAIPRSNNLLKYYLDDLQSDKKVVAVFGKHMPYRDTPIIQKIEIQCRWERFDRYTNSEGILLQSISHPFLPYTEENRSLWYALSNSASCYKRSFLLTHPFPKTDYGEDLLLGKKIIEEGYSKMYDDRCSVIHSHKFNFFEYYIREREDLTLRFQTMKLKEKNTLECKINKILSLNTTYFIKVYYLLQLFVYYLLKLLIIIEFKFK